MNYRRLWIYVAFVSSLFASQFAVAAYIAYAVGEQGKSPLPERVDDIEVESV